MVKEFAHSALRVDRKQNQGNRCADSQTRSYLVGEASEPILAGVEVRPHACLPLHKGLGPFKAVLLIGEGQPVLHPPDRLARNRLSEVGTPGGGLGPRLDWGEKTTWQNKAVQVHRQRYIPKPLPDQRVKYLS